LGEHHFFELLDYNPQAIKVAAALWSTKRDLTFVDLYNLMVEQKVREQNAQTAQATTNMQIQELKIMDVASYQLLRLVNYLP